MQEEEGLCGLLELRSETMHVEMTFLYQKWGYPVQDPDMRWRTAFLISKCSATPEGAA